MAATDSVALVKKLLSDNWSAASTDSVTPIFRGRDDREELKEVTPGKDLIRVYSGRPRTRTRLGNRYEFGRYEDSVTVDVMTSGVGGATPIAPGVHITKVLEEIERIVNLKKNNPDAYWQWMEIDQLASTEAEYAKFNRALTNVILRRWGNVP